MYIVVARHDLTLLKLSYDSETVVYLKLGIYARCMFCECSSPLVDDVIYSLCSFKRCKCHVLYRHCEEVDKYEDSENYEAVRLY